MTAALITATGDRIALDVQRWRSEPAPVETSLLSALADPVIDLGCGPGRLTAALAAAGRVVLGIDPSPAAVDEASGRGAPVLRRSVFAPLPGEGRWATALLLDGNIGIGGDPVRLLRRARELLRPHGVVIAELQSNGGYRSHMVRLDTGDFVGPTFPWATVGADVWLDLCAAAGLTTGGVHEASGRCFASARRP